jgi:hypothetical protein
MIEILKKKEILPETKQEAVYTYSGSSMLSANLKQKRIRRLKISRRKMRSD